MNRTASMWGDSLTAGIYASVRARSNYSLYNGGVSGETSTQIATRFLAASDATRGQKAVIWAGRNNYTDPTTVKADIASMVAAFNGQDYRVFSILNAGNEGIGTSAYNTIMQLNADLAAIYGPKYFDIRSYFVSLYDPNNAQDVIDHANDVTPSSLRETSSPFLHPNAAGYAALAPKYITVAGLYADTDGP